MGIHADQMHDLPIGGSVQENQELRHGMSHGDLYLGSLIRHTEAAIDHAQAHLAQARDELAKIRAAHAAGIQWQ